jgi:hypothetical protein
VVTLHDVAETDDQTELAATKSRVRDEFQVKVDDEMGRLVKAWTEAGRPGHDKAPNKRYRVAKTDRAEMKDVIRRAASLHKVAVSWFKDKVNEDGTVSIKFTVTPIPVKVKAAPAATATPPAEPAPATPAAPPHEAGHPGRFGKR